MSAYHSDSQRRSFPSSHRPVRIHRPRVIPTRNTPYTHAPGYSPETGLYLYGNVRLLHAKLTYIADAFGANHRPRMLEEMEWEAERKVLNGEVLVCGVHNLSQQRTACVPLRWGAPRILILSGGFYYHLGKDLISEPFQLARLWRYEFDAWTDLVISRRAPDKLPTFSHHNPTVDQMIELIATHRWPGLSSSLDLLMPSEETEA